MASLFFLLGLSMFGVFEIGTSLTGIGSADASRKAWTGSFMSGVLATIIATPCTAPFMGAALGYALTQPAWSSMLVFTFLGLGMATPYLLLSRFPQWLKVVPRPGPWMESLKQFMGFLLVGFTGYLIWVYTGQRGTEGLSRMLSGLLILGIAAWVFGRWAHIARPPRTRIVARVLALVLAAGGLALPLRAPTRIEWQTYSPELVENLRKSGEPVFIDFTAAWCLTCQVNKKVAINKKAVQDKFNSKGVNLVKADWTDRDPEIARVLESFGRSGVPVYVLYGRDPASEPVLLPEILTPGILLEALDRL
jgi:thiol:disulfide interchange protein DsbD